MYIGFMLCSLLFSLIFLAAPGRFDGVLLGYRQSTCFFITALACLAILPPACRRHEKISVFAMAACCKNGQPSFAYTGKQQNKSICVKKLANNLQK
ncbi:hypothetical protein A7Q00_04560 [Eikenella halliae]|uniref:Uncharacterized protein n=1 Tax=Eikenella halliae TaxID=1795832 RepID=A0A1B6VZN5_9NEIS|nr:hypothetical protein A7Q00_04560 [Eikenella halliae]